MKARQSFRQINRIPLRTWMIVILFISSVIVFFSFNEPTHVTMCNQSLNMINTPGYQELFYFGDEIDTGTVWEDKGARSFNHFYNPYNNWGLTYQSYFQLVGKLKNFVVPVPPGGMYPNALVWAKSLGASFYNWTDAINNYDYTLDSREFAYLALGHVVHCMQDMGQPDHAWCFAHPGSSFNTAKYQDPTREGYELYCETAKNTFQVGITPKLLPDIDNYFTELAKLSRQEATNLTLPNTNNQENAMGLKSATVDWSGLLGLNALGVGGLDPEVKIPWKGTINPLAAGTYFTYATLMHKNITEYGAGLLQLFYDIVNVPPYVKKVEFKQDFGGIGLFSTCYTAEWQDETVEVVLADQTIHKVTQRNLSSSGYGAQNKPSKLILEFGPSGDVPYGELIDPESITVNFGGVPLETGTFTQAWLGTHAIWESTVFISPAVQNAPLIISASDFDPHWQGRQPLGAILDKDPATPAKSGKISPYAWLGYEPGNDENHTIELAPVAK